MPRQRRDDHRDAGAGDKAALVDTPAVLIDVDIVLIRGNQFARYERVAVPGEGSLEYP